jgi:PAS domain S-box-containing protein
VSDSREKGLLEIIAGDIEGGKLSLKSEADILRLMERFDVGLCIVENDLVSYTNARFGEMVGFNPEEILKTAFMDYFSEDEREIISTRLDSSHTEADFGIRIDTELAHRSGRVIYVELYATMIEYGGRAALLAIFRSIARRKLMEKALTESEKRMRQIIDLVPHMIFAKDIHGRFLLVNQVVADAYGLSVEELTGKFHRDVHPNEDEVEHFLKNDREVIKSGRTKFIPEETFIDQNGHERILQTIKIPFTLVDSEDPAMLGVAVDITALKLAEERLRAAHQQLEATLNALPDLLFETDREGRIHDYRAPYPNLLYAEPNNFMDKTVNEILPEEAATIIMEAIDQAVKKGQSSGAVYSLKTGWGQRWFELSIAAKGDPKAKEVRFTALARDVTERKQAEDLLKQTADELQKQKEILTEKNIALKQILDHIESKTQDYRRKICRNLDEDLLPAMQRLKRKADSAFKGEIEALEVAIKNILSKDLDDFKSRKSKLTPREMDICEMIKNGMSSKQICDQLNLSLVTVHKHREQIRKKLGITNKNINLSTYLRSQEAE